MPDIRISLLPDAGAVTSGDFLHISQAGDDKRITIDDLSANFGEADIFGLNTETPLGTYYLAMSTSASVADNKKTTINDVSDLLQEDGYYATRTYWDDSDSYMVYRSGNSVGDLSQISLADVRSNIVDFSALNTIDLATLVDNDFVAVTDVSAGETKKSTVTTLRRKVLDPSSLTELPSANIVNSDKFHIWDESNNAAKYVSYISLVTALDIDLNTSQYVTLSTAQDITGVKTFSNVTNGFKVDSFGSIGGAGITIKDDISVTGSITGNSLDLSTGAITSGAITSTGLIQTTGQITSDVQVNVNGSILDGNSLYLNDDSVSGSGLLVSGDEGTNAGMYPRKGDDTGWENNRSLQYDATDNVRRWYVSGGLDITAGGNATNSGGGFVTGTGNLSVAGDATIIGDVSASEVSANAVKGDEIFPSKTHQDNIQTITDDAFYYPTFTDYVNSTPALESSATIFAFEGTNPTTHMRGVVAPFSDHTSSLGDANRTWGSAYIDDTYVTNLGVKTEARLPTNTYVNNVPLMSGSLIAPAILPSATSSLQGAIKAALGSDVINNTNSAAAITIAALDAACSDQAAFIAFVTGGVTGLATSGGSLSLGGVVINYGKIIHSSTGSNPVTTVTLGTGSLINYGHDLYTVIAVPIRATGGQITCSVATQSPSQIQFVSQNGGGTVSGLFFITIGTRN